MDNITDYNDNFEISKLLKGSIFNQPVDNLQYTITHLNFGYKFNNLVNNLPISITHLTFGNYFNQLVDDLPSSIIHLTFNNNTNFDKSLNNLHRFIVLIQLLNYYIHKILNISP